ncbi:MAG: rsxB 7 [Clostridia bacterium]|nr:rsxB 7 [Clostridia bacterium]
MKDIIITDQTKCEGCNRCVRVCPVSEANIAFLDKGQIKVRTDANKCIACGACLDVCQHKARSFTDDTERFFKDLQLGIKITVIVAPAYRINFVNGKSILAWLKTLGVTAVVDVSMGADICTWAHIRYIEKYNPKSLITQPCPAIVNYVEKYHPELVKKLSPVQSPMLCTAVYLKNYRNISDKIAALSPCVAKSNEFAETGIIGYNVTFKRLADYIQTHRIHIPQAEFEFDNIDSSLGKIFSMPGGLKENIEYYLGKSVRVDKSEGQSVVYNHIDEFARESSDNLPVIFDVLNCPEGCNLGTGCNHESSVFRINRIMDEQRKDAMHLYPKSEGAKFTKLFMLFDEKLKLADFIRKYKVYSISSIPYNVESVEQAFNKLGKTTEEQREHNCYACGYKTCHDMAVCIAKNINIPENCMERTRLNILQEHKAFISERSRSVENLSCISAEVEDIRKLFDDVLKDVGNVASTIEQYNKMASLISDMAFETQILSLNAAVEAAHAGEAGKGFAVVAQAIRDLASKSQKSVSEVANTSSFAKRTINAITDASENVDKSILKVSEYIGEISKVMNNLQDK